MTSSSWISRSSPWRKIPLPLPHEGKRGDAQIGTKSSEFPRGASHMRHIHESESDSKYPVVASDKGWEGLTFSRRVQWTSEATRPSHHGSSITAADPRLQGSQGAPYEDTGSFSGRRHFPYPALGHPYPCRSLSPSWTGAPSCPAQRSWLSVACCPEKPAVSPSPLSARPTWGDLELCVTTCRISNVPFCKSFKVAGCSSSLGGGWVTGSESPTPPPPPSLCPARTSCPRARARLTHRCPRVGGRGWQVRPHTGRAVPSGGRPALGLACRRPAPRQPVRSGHRRAPACARSRRGSQFEPPGASLPRSGNWGPGFAHAPPAPRAPRGGGLGMAVFLSSALG